MLLLLVFVSELIILAAITLNRTMGLIKNSLLDIIGNTPLIKLNSFDTGKCELFVKLENHNPGGSIKDRIGLTIIEEAENSGLLKKKLNLLSGSFK